MRKIFALVTCLLVAVINLWPFYSYTDVRAKYWTFGIPMKWLTVSHQDVPPEHYYFNVDYLSLLIAIAIWGALMASAFVIVIFGNKFIRRLR
jgi:hypothetical protein